MQCASPILNLADPGNEEKGSCINGHFQKNKKKPTSLLIIIFRYAKHLFLVFFSASNLVPPLVVSFFFFSNPVCLRLACLFSMACVITNDLSVIFFRRTKKFFFFYSLMSLFYSCCVCPTGVYGHRSNIPPLHVTINARPCSRVLVQNSFFFCFFLLHVFPFFFFILSIFVHTYLYNRLRLSCFVFYCKSSMHGRRKLI